MVEALSAGPLDLLTVTLVNPAAVSFAAALAAALLTAPPLRTWTFVPRAGPPSVGVVVGVVVAEAVAEAVGELVWDGAALAVLSSVSDENPGIFDDAVSYTHLRAHETRHDLVCRLLLEKKKK